MTIKKIAIIPARSGSKRIPNKNTKDFLGKPIISYPIDIALKSNIFDEVMVSTDCEKIAEISKKFGAKVPFLRSKKNSDDFSTTVNVIEEVLLEYKNLNQEFEITCCIYPTAVFINEDMLKIGLNKIINNDFDSLIPIVKFSHPIQRSLKIVNNHLEFFSPENINKRSQDLEPAYHDCGQFYFIKVNKFLETKKIFNYNSSYIELLDSEVQDIDNQEDWNIAELKYKLFHKN
jgi:N-acylneuraminate cytidylyltransferase